MSNSELKTVLITGANRGLGLELARAFLLAGWRVIAACREPDTLNLNDGRLSAVPLDLTNQHDIDALHELVDEPIDVLVNNAGLYDSDTGALDLAKPEQPNVVFNRLDDLMPVFAVNAIAPRLVTERLIDRLRAGHNRLVITISSENMSRFATADDYSSKHWPYSASKAALNYSMATFSTMFPDVTSVLVSPGWIKTRMGGDAAPLEAAYSGQRIAQLIIDSPEYLKDGTMIDFDGRVIDL